ncbi:MAG: peroxiredoxin [Sandaracinus sp.]|nr:peroxiredoxin [Sandaracinus sp.]|tara:strand:- start:10 stop:648 length:639 start_codon:yes stop_codon:yes gene_type:complete
MSLKLGSTAPDFQTETSEGPIEFHEWAGDDWVLFFSHPADYTPVCTTELGFTAKLFDDLKARHCKALALSVDPVDSHKGWIKDIEETQGVTMNFPIVADPDAKVAELYGMIHPEENAKLTVRSVFFIDPNKKVRATLTYPPATGRNFHELLRVLDGLQLTDEYQVATPANWKDGDDVVIVPSIKDPDEIAKKFPKGHKELKPYLRITPQPNK